MTSIGLPEKSSLAKLSPGRLDWLDASRGWAVFGVVCVHSGQVAALRGTELKITNVGQYGVQLFFVVSALTISMTYDSHIRRFGRSVRSQAAWLVKRFFRIAPLYYLAALFYPIEKYQVYVISHHRYGRPIVLPDILVNLLFLHTWVPSANNSVVPGGWSIGVEMFFYLLVPFIWLIAPVRRRIAVLGFGAVALLGLTFVFSYWLTGSYYVVDNSYLYFWFPTQAPVIALGLIFYSLRGPNFAIPRSRILGVACFAGSLASLILALDLGVATESAPAISPSVTAVSFILMILSLQGWLRRVLVNRFAIFLGKISFSIYILHFLVRDLTQVAVYKLHIERLGPITIAPVLAAILSVSIILALVSKRLIEDPAIAYGHRLSASLVSRKQELMSQ